MHVAKRPLDHLDIDLKPVSGGDLVAVYALAAMVAPSWQRVCGQGLPPMPAFESALWDSVHSIHKLTRDGALLGVCGLHNVDAASRNGWIEVVVAPGPDALAVAASVITWLAGEARDRQSLRKLSMSHASFGPSPLTETDLQWCEEARLRETVRHEDFLWDLVIDAIWLSED